jgi:hypothetical protein
MASQPLDLVGSWEEILRHSHELAGQRVRLTVLPSAGHNGTKPDAIRPASGRSLLRHIGAWSGDDLDDCLREVVDSRAPALFM